jgi:hypothetical protein
MPLLSADQIIRLWEEAKQYWRLDLQGFIRSAVAIRQCGQEHVDRWGKALGYAKPAAALREEVWADSLRAIFGPIGSASSCHWYFKWASNGMWIGHCGNRGGQRETVLWGRRAQCRESETSCSMAWLRSESGRGMEKGRCA